MSATGRTITITITITITVDQVIHRGVLTWPAL